MLIKIIFSTETNKIFLDKYSFIYKKDSFILYKVLYFYTTNKFPSLSIKKPPLDSDFKIILNIFAGSKFNIRFKKFKTFYESLSKSFWTLIDNFLKTSKLKRLIIFNMTNHIYNNIKLKYSSNYIPLCWLKYFLFPRCFNWIKESYPKLYSYF